MPGTFELKVPSDGVTLAVRGHEVMDPRGALFIAPGFAEHAGRYTRLAQELGSRGYSTYAYDPRGHGKSTGQRGHTPSWKALVQARIAGKVHVAQDIMFMAQAVIGVRNYGFQAHRLAFSLLEIQ